MLKKILLSSILSLGLVSTLNAYEVNGDLGVKWTGHKNKVKVGVPGTFKNIKLSIEKNDDLVKFLQSANVTIDAMSLDSKMPFRDNNITSTLFALTSAKEIKELLVQLMLQKMNLF